jgi:hypothetical protein
MVDLVHVLLCKSVLGLSAAWHLSHCVHDAQLCVNAQDVL